MARGKKAPEAKPGSVVVSETSTSTWSYHMRRVGEDGRLYLGGGAPPALCGRALGWDTKIPASAWGKTTHLGEKWCLECAKVAAEEMTRAALLPALEIAKKGLKEQGWLSTTGLPKLSVGGRSLHKTELAAARHAAQDLEAWEDVVLKPGSEFLVGRVLSVTIVAGTFMEIRTVDGLVRYVVGKDGKARRRKAERAKAR